MPATHAAAMAPSQVAYAGVRAPRGWLGVAFVGVWLYFIAKIMELYPERLADSTQVGRGEALQMLAIIAGLASILFFSGLVSALWRANLAAGLSPASVRGLVFGSAGVGVLVVFESARLLDWVGMQVDALRSLLLAVEIGDIAGNALAFAGLAFLVVGLAEAAGIFGRAEPEVPRAAPEETS